MRGEFAHYRALKFDMLLLRTLSTFVDFPPPNVQRVHQVNRPFFSSEDSDPDLGFQTFPIIFHPDYPDYPDYERNEILGRMICDELTIERCGVIAVKTSARRFRKQRGDLFRSDGRASGETSVVSLNTL